MKEFKGDFVIYDFYVLGYYNFIVGNMLMVVYNIIVVLVLVREFFGENWRYNFLELNVSDERGINVICEKVKEFVRMKLIGGVSFKIIFFDEVDVFI